MTAASTARVPLIAGNWKLHHTLGETQTLCQMLVRELTDSSQVQVLVAPPFTSLHAAKAALGNSGIALGAQNCFYADKGAFTGEISPPMLLDVGCTHVIVGHSERRQIFLENDSLIARKFWALKTHGLIPILCVGETLDQRKQGQAQAVVLEQLEAVFREHADAPGGDEFVVAYEPVWAIGTGQTATPDDAQTMHQAIRQYLTARLGQDTAQQVRVLYGGSVKPDNALALASEADVDGALVGGASLNATDFLAIVRATQEALGAS